MQVVAGLLIAILHVGCDTGVADAMATQSVRDGFYVPCGWFHYCILLLNVSVVLGVVVHTAL